MATTTSFAASTSSTHPDSPILSNEPVFLTVYLYHYAGRPALSAQRIHTYVPSAFNDTAAGLPATTTAEPWEVSYSSL